MPLRVCVCLHTWRPLLVALAGLSTRPFMRSPAALINFSDQHQQQQQQHEHRDWARPWAMAKPDCEIYIYYPYCRWKWLTGLGGNERIYAAVPFYSFPPPPLLTSSLPLSLPLSGLWQRPLARALCADMLQLPVEVCWSTGFAYTARNTIVI